MFWSVCVCTSPVRLDLTSWTGTSRYLSLSLFLIHVYKMSFFSFHHVDKIVHRFINGKTKSTCCPILLRLYKQTTWTATWRTARRTNNYLRGRPG